MAVVSTAATTMVWYDMAEVCEASVPGCSYGSPTSQGTRNYSLPPKNSGTGALIGFMDSWIIHIIINLTCNDVQ